MLNLKHQRVKQMEDLDVNIHSLQALLMMTVMNFGISGIGVMVTIVIGFDLMIQERNVRHLILGSRKLISQ